MAGKKQDLHAQAGINFNHMTQPSYNTERNPPMTMSAAADLLTGTASTHPSPSPRVAHDDPSMKA